MIAGNHHVVGNLIRSVLSFSFVTLSYSCSRIRTYSALSELTIQGHDRQQSYKNYAIKGLQIKCSAHKIKWEQLFSLTLQMFDSDAGAYIDLVISSEGERKNMPQYFWANLKTGFFSNGHAQYGMDPVNNSGGKRELFIRVYPPMGSAQYRCVAMGVDRDGTERLDTSARAFVNLD